MPSQTPVLPDDAYAAFKQAEAQLLSDQSNLNSAQDAQSALLAAQKTAADAAQGQVDNASTAVTADAPKAVLAAYDLIQSLQAFVAANTTPGQ